MYQGALEENWLLGTFLMVQWLKVLVTQSCPALCDPMDCSRPAFSSHGILQAKILEWIVVTSSRESSQLRALTHISYVSCIGRSAITWEALVIKNLPSTAEDAGLIPSQGTKIPHATTKPTAT